MAAPDTTLDKVRYRLLDTSTTNPQLDSDTILQEAVAMALTRYSRDRPRTVIEDLEGAGSGFFLLAPSDPEVDPALASWVQGYSNIQKIEYPAEAVGTSYTPRFLDNQHDWTDDYPTPDGVYLRLLGIEPAVGETLRITYSTPHVHSDEEDSVPAGDLNALCDLAAHFGCLILATKAAGFQDNVLVGDSTNYRDSQLRYKQQAQEWLNSYLGQLGIPAGESGAPAVVAASANSNWYLQYQSGAGFITHGPRRRG